MWGNGRNVPVIVGAHSIIYSKNPEADRAFLRDVLKFPSVDVGHGWLIFGLPPAEVAVHPSEHNDVHEFYLMCTDVEALIQRVERARGGMLAVSEPGMGTADSGDSARRRKAGSLSAAPRTSRADDRAVNSRCRIEHDSRSTHAAKRAWFRALRGLYAGPGNRLQFGDVQRVLRRTAGAGAVCRSR